jgi:hypothetical protein
MRHVHVIKRACLNNSTVEIRTSEYRNFDIIYHLLLIIVYEDSLACLCTVSLFL